MYIADSDNNQILYYSGTMISTVVAGRNGGSINNDQLKYPLVNIYIADGGNHRIQFFSGVESNGMTIAGDSRGLIGENASFLWFPNSVLLDSQVNLYVSDNDNQRIQKFMRY